MEIPNELLLNLKRALFDVSIRDCGRIDHKIFEKFGTDSDIKGWINLRAAICSITVLCKDIPNPTGQIGLDTRFYDGIKKQD